MFFVNDLYCNEHDVMFGHPPLNGLSRAPKMTTILKQDTTRANLCGHTRPPSWRSRLQKPNLFNLLYKRSLSSPSPIPIFLHDTAENAVVCGYHIPKRTRLLRMPWFVATTSQENEGADQCMGHLPWQECKGRPERFLKEGAPNFTGRHFEFIPFGSGLRACPGTHLGLYTLKLTVAHLLHGFNWELPHGMKPSNLNMHEAAGISSTLSQRPNPRLIH